MIVRVFSEELRLIFVDKELVFSVSGGWAFCTSGGTEVGGSGPGLCSALVASP